MFWNLFSSTITHVLKWYGTLSKILLSHKYHNFQISQARWRNFSALFLFIKAMFTDRFSLWSVNLHRKNRGVVDSCLVHRLKFTFPSLILGKMGEIYGKVYYPIYVSSPMVINLLFLKNLHNPKLFDQKCKYTTTDYLLIFIFSVYCISLVSPLFLGHYN